MGFKFPKFLVVEDNSAIRDNNGTYRYTTEELTLYELGSNVPLIVLGKGCIGIATIMELHIRTYGTTIFYKLDSRIKDNAKKAYYELYCIDTPDAPVVPSSHAGNPSSFASSAVGMDMGINKSPRQIARGSDDFDSFPHKKRGLSDFLDDIGDF